MTITQQPDALSLSGNLKKLIFSGVSAPLSFSLSVGGGVILTQQYSPDADGQVIIDIKDVVESHLSLTLSDVQSAYQQSGVVRDFSYSVNAGVPVTFRVIRAGIDAFSDTAANFLAANFLTWQPQIKHVTYYTPENLTYYAAVAALVKLKLYYADGDPVTVTLDSLTSGKCWTIPVTYARILAASGSEVLPGAYDIWIENVSGNRLTYIQRYIADSLPAEDESWVIFENSLGGFDTFRATGTDDLTGTHTHNLAEVDGISEDYRVDTERVHKKSTGYLDMKQRLWLLDFFPSRRKWVYISSAMRSIVLTEDEVTYTINNMPSEFSFSYKYADAKPYLNIARVQTLPTVLQIVTPDLQSFSLPPRLVEFAHQTITEGALLPVQNPYSDVWGAVTFGSIVDFVSSRLGMPSGGGVSAWSPNSLLAVDANGQVGSLQEVAHSNLLLASNIGAAPSYKSIDAILGLNAEGYVRRSAAGVYSTDLNLTASDYVRIGTSKFVATESGLNLIGSDGSARSLCVFGGIFSGGIADFGEVGGSGYNSIIHLGSGNVITSLVDNGSTLEAHKDLSVYSQSQVNGLISSEVTDRNTAISDAINLLDVASVGGAGKYISAISQADGKISATLGTLPTQLSQFTDNLGSSPIHTHSQYMLGSARGAVNGVAPLDINSKIPAAYLYDYFFGQVLYGGGLGANALATLTSLCKSKLGTASSTITLTNNNTAITGYTSNEGIYYIITAAQTFAGISFEVGDWCISNGSAWTKVDNTDAVASVAGLTGAISKASLLSSLNVADGAQVNVLEGVKLNGTALSPTSKVVNVNACASITVPTGLSVASLTTGGLIAISLATGYAIPTSVNIAQIATNATNITTLQGYFTDGSAKSAIKLLNARTLWGQSFDGTTNVSGNMTGVGSLDASGDIRTSERIYGAKGIFSGGIADLGETISSGYNLIYTTGTGNAVTSVDDNGSTLNIHKDITFALASDVVNSLATKVDKVAGYGLSKNDLSDVLLSALNANTTARHSHTNKALLDTYTQTEANMASAVSLKHTHSNKTILDATTASFLAADRIKLDGIAANANNYSLPIASSIVLGGIKVGSRLTITSGVLSADVQSDYNFNSTYKTKLDGIAANANLYVHPSYTAQASGLYKVTVDSSGHVSAVVAVAKSDITGLGIPAQDTVYTHPSSGVTAGTYRSVTVNANGHVTAGTNPTTLVGYGITDAASASELSTLDANIDACIGSLAGQVLSLQAKNHFEDFYAEYANIRTLSSDLFVGYLKGNADSASKLLNARTLWGQSFDGTANVSGALSGVTTLEATGALHTTNVIRGDGGVFSGGIGDLGEIGGGGYNDILPYPNESGNAVTYLEANGSTLYYHLGSFSLSTHNHNSVYSVLGHTHDDRYYTETEIGSILGGSTSITGYNKSNWDTAYGWGNHASVGYASQSALTTHANLTTTAHGLGASAFHADNYFALAGHNHSGVYQPLDADLTAIAGLTGTSGFLKKTAANTWSLDTNVYLTTHQTIYALTIQKNGATIDVYTPNSSSKTINISDVASASALSSLDAATDACFGALAGEVLSLQAKNQYDELYAEYANIRTLSSDLFIGYLKGNADTASAFSAAKSIALTGDITGSASSTGGWYVNTAIGAGKVTNAMLAGSIENSKLLHSSLQIGNTTIALGSQASTLIGLTSVSATTFYGALSGNANTATTFQSAQSITLSGDITGSVSSTGGWSIATAIGAGRVTNAMLAGSIDNSKLVNYAVTISGQYVALGGSISRTALRTGLGLQGRAASMNGTTYYFASYDTYDATSFTAYAPTAAGTIGQLLISTGGTPSWVSQGAGGGIDADKLDNMHAVDFVNVANAQTITGTKTFSASVSILNSLSVANNISAGGIIQGVGGVFAGGIADLQEDNWTTPALTNGMQGTTYGAVRYRLIGTNVQIDGSFTVTISDTNGLSIFQLPTGYRPVHKMSMLMYNNSAGIWRCVIGTDGQVWVNYIYKISDGSLITVATTCMFDKCIFPTN